MGVMEQLVQKKENLAKQMAEVDATIEMFEKNPGVEECLSQLSRVGIYR